MYLIYHNPKCSKSRTTLELLRNHTDQYEIREYLKEPLSLEELRQLSQKLSLKPSEFLRKKEKVISESQLDISSEEEILKSMVREPKIIERPIVEKGDLAIIGRPPENIKELFDS